MSLSYVAALDPEIMNHTHQTDASIKRPRVFTIFVIDCKFEAFYRYVVVVENVKESLIVNSKPFTDR